MPNIQQKIRFHSSRLRDIHEELRTEIPDHTVGKFHTMNLVSDAIDALDNAYLSCPRPDSERA